MRDLAASWPHGKPDRVYCSTLPRSAESALILAQAWGATVRVLDDLREWSPTTADIPQEEYLRREEACWNDHDLEFDTGESINEATARLRGAFLRIVGEVREGTVAVVGHGMAFTMFLATVRGTRPDIEYKRKIRNAAVAVVEHEDATFRIRNEFF
jgi:broad specificity phosphatase PhoE